MVLFADAETISISAVVSSIVSALVAFGVNAFMNRGHNERMVYGQVQKMLEFAMSYPYLEDDAFCAAWPAVPDDKDNEKQQRYEYYCCHLFNTLERVYDLCEFDTDCMAQYLYPDELIVRHWKWWRHDPHNLDGYSDGFKAFVERIIRKHGVGE